MVHYDNTVRITQELDLVSREDDRFVLEELLNRAKEYVRSNVLVNSGERIIKKVHVCVCVHGTRQTDALLLPAR